MDVAWRDLPGERFTKRYSQQKSMPGHLRGQGLSCVPSRGARGEGTDLGRKANS